MERAVCGKLQLAPGTFFFEDNNGEATTVAISDAVASSVWEPGMPLFTVTQLQSPTQANQLDSFVDDTNITPEKTSSDSPAAHSAHTTPILSAKSTPLTHFTSPEVRPAPATPTKIMSPATPTKASPVKRVHSSSRWPACKRELAFSGARCSSPPQVREPLRSSRSPAKRPQSSPAARPSTGIRKQQTVFAQPACVWNEASDNSSQQTLSKSRSKSPSRTSPAGWDYFDTGRSKSPGRQALHMHTVRVYNSGCDPAGVARPSPPKGGHAKPARGDIAPSESAEDELKAVASMVQFCDSLTAAEVISKSGRLLLDTLAHWLLKCDDGSVLDAICRALVRIAGSSDGAAALARAGILRTLVGLLAKLARHEHAPPGWASACAASCCVVLRRMIKLGSQDEAFIAAGGIKTVLALCRMQGSWSAVATAALSVIKTCSARQPLQQPLREARAPEVLCLVLEDRHDVPDMRAAALAALDRMGQFEPNRPIVCTERMMRAAIRAAASEMRERPMRHVLTLLWSAAREERLHDAIVQAGGVELLVRATSLRIEKSERLKREMPLEQIIGAVLRELCDNDRIHCSLLDHNIQLALVALCMRVLSATYATCAIACSPMGAAKLAEAGGLRAMWMVCNGHCETVLLMEGAGCLGRMCEAFEACETEVRRLIEDAGVELLNEQLVRMALAMLRSAEQAEQAITGCVLVRVLSTSCTNAEWLLQQDVIQHVVDVMQVHNVRGQRLRLCAIGALRALICSASSSR